MIRALKDRFGLTPGVNQLRQELKGQYEYYPQGIAKVELDRSVRMRDWVNLYLNDPFDFEILREIADENGYVYENDSTWFGFYEASDLNADNTRGSILGNFNKTGPVPFNVSLLNHNSMDDFRLWVVASHLEKKYEEPNKNALKSNKRSNTANYCKTTISNKMINSAVEGSNSSRL